jgi:hypothetical protein
MRQDLWSHELNARYFAVRWIWRSQSQSQNSSLVSWWLLIVRERSNMLDSEQHTYLGMERARPPPFGWVHNLCTCSSLSGGYIFDTARKPCSLAAQFLSLAAGGAVAVLVAVAMNFSAASTSCMRSNARPAAEIRSLLLVCALGQ